MHPLTPVVHRDNTWYKLHHSKHLGYPYHTGGQVEVYTPTETSKDETNDPINLQIRSTSAIIEPSGPGSLHCARSIEQGTPPGP